MAAVGGKVYLIGAGPGDPGLFTLRGKEILENADVVVYDYLANDALLAFARPDAERIYVGKKGGDHTLSQEGINALIVAKAREGKSVARLKGGDPYMFGRGGEEAEELLAAGLPFEVAPGVTSGIAGPAYAGIPLTHRAHSSSVVFVTGHEDPAKPDTAHNWPALAASGSTLVFYMGMKNLPDISRKLIDAGLAPTTPAALVRWGTTSRHRSLVSTLAALPAQAVEHGFSAPSLIVVGSVVTLHGLLNWFEQKPLLGKGIVVTRAREQASDSAALLREQGADVIQFPTISISPLEDYREVRDAIGRLASYHLAVFTSVNGVRHFWRQLETLGLDSRALGGIKVAAIGPATATALVSRGIRPDLLPEKYVAESVASGILAMFGNTLDGLRILIPRARVARDVLPSLLAEAGARVDVTPVYETTPSGEKRDEVLARLRAGDIQCITFGSSSTVENFLSLIPVETLKAYPDLRFACIGPITAATLEKAGLTCHVQPEEYSIPGLVAALVEYFKTDSGPPSKKP
ncbi:MAG: uroporphyrinogen-III C-methyltransferase [Desulfovibrio sp.]|jgi:uroporphyrinogen III methyltransferase/synthase|nr:uroporphyrinogen-III C-methyltransferase [Desulfovibrio sp.]